MIAVLGVEGMLGHKMFQVLAERHEHVFGTTRGSLEARPYGQSALYRHGSVVEGVDASDWNAIYAVLRERRPHVVVNCIGVIKQRPEAEDPIASIALNALLPHRLAEACGNWGGKLVHFSTDCVFSGSKGDYTELDLPDAHDLYGRSKFLGEVSRPNALTLRTSIIGRELKQFSSLLEWFLAQEGNSIRGFRRVIYSGVTTNHMAAMVADLLERPQWINGLYHVAAPPISKFDLLCRVRDAFGVNIEIIPEDSIACDRSLSDGPFRRESGFARPNWDSLIDALARDGTPYDDWRSRSRDR